MSVWCRQSSDLTGVQEYALVTEQTDEEWLLVKEASAKEKGWTVTRTGPSSFTATKVRWGGVLCTREFWIA